MNNSYSSYVNYVEATDYYKDLSSALTKIGNISDNIDTLINALGKNNGPNITSAITDLEDFKTNLGLIATYYGLLKSSLDDNAKKYDNLYSKLNIPSLYIPIFYFDSYQVDRSVTYGGFHDIFNINGHIASMILSKAYVSISSDLGYIGYIKYEITKTTTKYHLKNSAIEKQFDIEFGKPEDCLKSSLPIISVDKVIYYYNKDHQRMVF